MTRLDQELVQRGLTTTRSKAQALILAGVVQVDGEFARKSGETVGPENEITLLSPPRFVSRGGEKLEHALWQFQVELAGKICTDIGASTGGFTDAMLQRGAKRVYAVDVGYGQIAYELRNDPRVVVMDRTNARYLETLPDPIAFTSVDASFISLAKLFPAIGRISEPGAEVIALIKPQFEAGKGEVGKGGVVRDDTVHARVLSNVISCAASNELNLVALTASPIKGPAGNVEFLGYFRLSPSALDPLEVASAIERAMAGAPT